MAQVQHEDGDDAGRGVSAAPARGWRPAIWQGLVGGVMVAAVVLGTVGASTAAANGGEDVCPEPNDRLQAACNIGIDSDALGFISSPGDRDAYRLVTHDFGARVHLALPDRPHPYRIALVGYDGKVLHSSEAGNIDTVLDQPGTYYAIVESATGESDSTAPYRIRLGIRHPMGMEPTVLYSEGYGLGDPRTFTLDDGTVHEGRVQDPDGTYGEGDGHFFANIAVEGTPDDPTAMTFTIKPTNGGPPNTVDDFTLTIDSEMVEPANAGYTVTFRVIDESNFLRLTVDLKSKVAKLSKVVKGELTALTDWTPVQGLRETGINRTVIRCVGTEIRASINGKLVARVHDDTFSEGLFGFGATTWGGPATIYFDNILVTTPTLE